MCSVSVCIAAHNEESTIANTVASIAAQRGPRIGEILICTNGCTDGTEQVVRRLGREIRALRSISLAEAGKPRAWNVLFQQAREPVVVFADADVLVAPDAVRHLVRALEADPHLLAVGARPVPLTLGLRPLHRYLSRPPTAIASLVGRLYAVRRVGLARQMAELGMPAMPPAVIADDLWVTLVVGRRRWAEAPGAVVYYLPPATSEVQETYRRAHRARRQLKALMPDRYREQQEQRGHRYRRWAEELLSPIGIASKTRSVLSSLARFGVRGLTRLETALESPEKWTSTWKVAKASKDGGMMMAGVRQAREYRARWRPRLSPGAISLEESGGVGGTRPRYSRHGGGSGLRPRSSPPLTCRPKACVCARASGRAAARTPSTRPRSSEMVHRLAQSCPEGYDGEGFLGGDE